jgi:hypothetical protein
MLGGMWQTLASLLLAIEIHGAGECPAAGDVERRLGPLLGAPTAADPSDVATIKHAADGTLSVSLADSAGRPLGDRRFPRAGSCENQAETVAVTLAIWEAQIHPEISLRLDRLSPEATPAPAQPEPTTLRHVPEAAPHAGTTVTLGASVAGDWQSGAVAPAGRVELGLGPAGSRWRARFGVLGVARHTLDVAPGQASWWRASFSVGADLDVARGRHFALVLGADALGGVASISGAGFAVNRTSRSVDAGGELRARVEWRPGRVRPWVGVALVGWVRRQGLDLEGTGTASALPRLEPLAALGADIAW